MKNYITIIAFLALCTSLSAQTKFGFKTSVSKIMADQAQNYISTDNVTITYDVAFAGFNTGSSIGMFTQTSFDFLFLQTEALFTSYKTEYIVTSFIDEVVNNPLIEETNNFDLQIIAGIQKNNWRFGVGPVFHKTLDFKSDFEQFAFYGQEKRSMNFGFLGLVGYNFGPVHVDLKYENMFNKIGDHMSFSNRKAKFHSNISALSLGIGVGF